MRHLLLLLFSIVQICSVWGLVCEYPTSEVQITRVFHDNAYQESWLIYEGQSISGSPVISGRGDSSYQRGSSKTYSCCMSLDQNYTLVLRDSYGDGWGVGSTNIASISLSFQGILLFQTTMEYQDSQTFFEYYFPFTLQFPILPKDTWKYIDELNSSDIFQSIDYNDSSWFISDPSSSSPFNNFTQTVRYYRKQVQLHNSSSSLLFEVGLYTQFSFILYINGYLIYEYNLQHTNTTYEPSFILYEDSSPEYRIISFNPSLYFTLSSSLVFSIVIYFSNSVISTQDPFLFFFNVRSLFSPIPRFFGGTFYCLESRISNLTSDTCSNAFDYSIYTNYISSTNTAQLYYQFNSYRREWINMYSITSSPDTYIGDPKQWSLYGRNQDLIDKQNSLLNNLENNSDEGWILLDIQINQFFSERSKTYYYPIVSNHHFFNEYKLDIQLNYDASHSLQLSEFSIYSTSQLLFSDSLTYSSTLFSYPISSPIYIVPLSTGFTNYTIKPSILPSTLVFNSITGVLSGSITSLFNQTFIITAESSISHSSFSFTLLITECNLSTHIALDLIKQNNLDTTTESFIITNSKSVLVFESEGSFYNGNQDYFLCFPMDIYTLTLSSTTNIGWSSNSILYLYLYISEFSSYLAHIFNLSSGSTASYTLNLSYIIHPYDDWSYLIYSSSIPTIPSEWFHNDYSKVNNWPSYNAKNSYLNPMSVWLYRKTFTLHYLHNYTSYELLIHAQSGFRLYINDKMIFNYNLPMTDLYWNSTSTISYVAPVWRQITGNLNVFKTETNVLSVLIADRMPSESLNTTTYNKNSFDLVLRLLATTLDISRAYHGTVYSSIANTESQQISSLSTLFDYNKDTYWKQPFTLTTQNQTIIYQFNEDRYESINSYCIINTEDSYYYDPVSWIVYGITNTSRINNNIYDINNYILLSTESYISWNSRNQKRCFYMNTKDSYFLNTIMFIFTNSYSSFWSLSDTYYAISEIEFHIQNLTSARIPSFFLTPSTLLCYTDVPVPKINASSLYFSKFTITPQLPTSLYLDSRSGFIIGIPRTSISNEYTISTTDIWGNIYITYLQLIVTDCSYPNHLMTLFIYFQSMSIGDQFELVNLLTNETIAKEIYLPSHSYKFYSYCEPISIYDFILYDSSYNGWDSSYFNVILDSTIILYGSLSYGESPKHYQFNAEFSIRSLVSQWSYYQEGQLPSSDWYLLSYNYTQWPTSKSLLMPIPNGITQYYITTFQIPSNIDQFPSMEINLYNYGGFIIYINGIEVIRRNLPINETIEYSTYSSVFHLSYTLYRYLISIDDIQLYDHNENRICIEIHRGSITYPQGHFDCSLRFVYSNERRMIDGTISSNIQITGQEGISKLIDNIINTKFYSSYGCINTELIYSYNYYHEECINSYMIVSGNNCNNYHPSSWKFEGYDSSLNSWILLDVQTDIFFTTYRETRIFSFKNKKYYSKYKLTVLKCDNSQLIDDNSCNLNGFQLSEFSLFVQKINKSICIGENGYTDTYDSQYAYKNCDTLYTGYKQIYCINGSFQNEISNCIPIAPSNITLPSSSFLFYKNINIEPITPIVIGLFLEFVLTPELPNGLIYSTSNGTISGTPKEYKNLTTYTLYVLNPTGFSVISFSMEIESLSCPAEDGWTETVAGEYAYQNCTNLIYSSGTITRYCKPQNPPEWSSTISNNCIVKIPLIYYPVTIILAHIFDPIPIYTPTVSGISTTSFSINPDPPSCFFFNTTTGILEGTPDQNYSIQFTISIGNEAGYGSTILTLIASPVNCPEVDKWPETPRYEKAYLFCSSPFEGVETRLCQYKDYGTSEWSLVDTSNCFILENGDYKPSVDYKLIDIDHFVQGLTYNTMQQPKYYELYRLCFYNEFKDYIIAKKFIYLFNITSTTLENDTLHMHIEIYYKPNYENIFKEIVQQYITDTSFLKDLRNADSHFNSIENIILISITDITTSNIDKNTIIFYIIIFCVLLCTIVIIGLIIYFLKRYKQKSNRIIRRIQPHSVKPKIKKIRKI